ncbi:DUF1906 domain-containing protein [Chromobacterium alkanivorans]|uniref:glycoside hydrolase domain-containing protein n=1 Tax=Chromobacterium alkanivorans TaxID=1071719 RepID=UPI001967E0CA|nr:glycoside hydrolase domain-containing protein [Chromobacterium alkanivorans]MBN3004364.1 DUF1906 domain-containing protein [Chromobacterium alkanivorans]
MSDSTTPYKQNGACVAAAPAGAHGFDADTPLSLELARQFAASGYRFCVRYLTLGPNAYAADLSAGEAQDILGAGLALMAVQHVRDPGWSPNAAMGKSDGQNTVAHAQTAGLLPGVNVWCDLEGVADGASGQDVADYCTQWFEAVSNAAYAPGLYVGSAAGLSGTQLYELPFQHYWQSCSSVPSIPQRGYQMVQTLVPQTVNGIGIDADMTQTDQLGGTVKWQILA